MNNYIDLDIKNTYTKLTLQPTKPKSNLAIMFMRLYEFAAKKQYEANEEADKWEIKYRRLKMDTDFLMEDNDKLRLEIAELKRNDAKAAAWRWI